MSMITTLLFGLVATTPAEVAALIETDQLEEASALLNDVTEEWRPRFEGMIALKEGRPADAVLFFEHALEVAEDQPDLHLYLAHAYLLTDQNRKALSEAEKAKTLAGSVIAQPMIEARARRILGDLEGAYDTLERATRTFPEESSPRLELVSLAEECGLSAVARRHTEHLLARAFDRDTALAVFQLLYRDPKARPILEALSARFPRDAEIRAHLAYSYAAAEEWFASARLFEQATRMGGDYAFEAADQYRVSERYEDALRMNAQVRDPQRRNHQRINILFDGKRYARVVAFSGFQNTRDLHAEEPGVGDPAILYRIAYAYYVLGQQTRATDLARTLSSTSYRDQAKALLKAMGRAVEEP